MCMPGGQQGADPNAGKVMTGSEHVWTTQGPNGNPVAPFSEGATLWKRPVYEDKPEPPAPPAENAAPVAAAAPATGAKEAPPAGKLHTEQVSTSRNELDDVASLSPRRRRRDDKFARIGNYTASGDKFGRVGAAMATA